MSGAPMDDETRSLLGAYALGAVDDAERARVDELLRRSASARAELARYESVLVGLTDAEATVAPPAGSWDRLRAVLHADEPADGTGAVPPLRPLPAARPAAAAAPEDATGVVIPLRPRRRRLALLASAAAVVVAGVVGGVAVTAQRGPSRRDAYDAALADAGSVRGDVVVTEGGARLRAVVTPGGDGFLVASALPRLPAGQTYQLWSLDGAAPVSLGVLGNRPDLVMFSTGDQVRTMALSVERSPGASSPTLPPVAVGTLA